MSERPEDDDDDEPGFLAKYRIPVIGGAIVLVGVGIWFGFFKKDEKPARKSSSVSMVNLLPPPPPPPPPTPPPTPPPQQPEEETPEETKQEFVEETAADSAPEPEEAPQDAPLGTNVEGPGSDSFGLAKGGGGGMIGGLGQKKGGGGGSKFGPYAGQVQSRVSDALRSHKKTRSASLSLKVRIWVDPTGRVNRVAVTGASDASIEKAIREEVLAGLQLPSAPPEGMPMPIVMRITAKRPN